MRNTPILLSLLLALALISSACSDDNSGDSTNQSTTTIAGNDDAPEPDDEVDGASTDATNAEQAPAVADDPTGLDEGDLDVISSSSAVNDLITAANTDGVVDTAEMTEILETGGTPAAQAGCEGALLASLGVTDPTNLDQIKALQGEMTQEQLIALTTCMAAG